MTMMDESHISEHMAVVGLDGQHVGTVDHVDGAAIKLTKNDSADGQHHWIPMDWVETVDDQVHLSLPSQQVMQQWMTSNSSGS